MSKKISISAGLKTATSFLFLVAFCRCGGSDSAVASTDDAGTVSTGGSISGTGGVLANSGGVPSSTGGVPGSDASSGGAASNSGGSSGLSSGGAADGATADAGTTLPPACSLSATLTPGETVRTIDVGGVSRTYILHVPTSYTGATPVPLVLDFHPIFGTGAVEEANSGYLALSDAEGFIIAYPDGIDNAWNIGPCCTFSRDVDDEGFARAIVNEVSAEGCVDAKRVYATGYSMGGGMSYYLACNAADVFAAVAPSAFDLLVDSEEPCAPSRPITVIAFRGTADLIVPYSGGASNPPNGLQTTIHFLGAVATFEKWQSLDGCSGTAATDGDCQIYSTCSAGVEVTLCTTVGGGHVTGDARIGWDTMKRHAMP